MQLFTGIGGCMARKVVAVYKSFYAANGAVRELQDYGFSAEQINLTANSANQDYEYQVSQLNSGFVQMTGLADEHQAGGRIGAGIGAAAGLVAGALAVLNGSASVWLMILAVGAGALVGLALGRLLGTLIGLGIPEKEAEQYAECVRQGNVRVAVQAETYHLGLVYDILGRYRPEDFLVQ
jgi:hypothetical protein